MRLAFSAFTTRLPLPISPSMCAAPTSCGDWNSASTSRSIIGVSAYAKRTPPPGLSARPKALSYLV